MLRRYRDVCWKSMVHLLLKEIRFHELTSCTPSLCPRSAWMAWRLVSRHVDRAPRPSRMAAPLTRSHTPRFFSLGILKKQSLRPLPPKSRPPARRHYRWIQRHPDWDVCESMRKRETPSASVHWPRRWPSGLYNGKSITCTTFHIIHCSISVYTLKKFVFVQKL